MTVLLWVGGCRLPGIRSIGRENLDWDKVVKNQVNKVGMGCEQGGNGWGTSLEMDEGEPGHPRMPYRRFCW